MKKEEILNASRKEYQNKDLAEMEMIYRAGSHASRVTIMFFILSVLAFVGFVRQILEVSI